MIEIENDMLNVMIEKPLVENNISSECKIFKAKIKELNEVLQGFTSSKEKS